MESIDLLQNVEFVVDSQGKKKCVLLYYEVWEELLASIEDLEDAEEIRRLRDAGEEAIPWKQAGADLVTE